MERKLPEFLVLSTSLEKRETFAFEGNAEGVIQNYHEHGAMADRNGDLQWYRHQVLINRIDHRYQKVRDIPAPPSLRQTLWKLPT